MLFAFLAVLCGLAFLLDIALGSVTIPFEEIVTILAGGETGHPSWRSIVVDLRLPGALTALCAGAALALGGLQMQTLFQNPLAGPYVLGINAGASLGVALVVLASSLAASAAGIYGTTIAACLGSALVLAVVLWVARYLRSNMALLLLGVMLGYATQALVSILMHLSSAQQLQSYILWSFGSFRSVTWEELALLGGVVMLGAAAAGTQLKGLNLLLLGERYARTMGLETARTRALLIVSTALLAGGVTAFCGPIAFLGVAIPHLCRGLFATGDHRVLFPACVLLGGTVALAADLLSQLPGTPLSLPLNAVTSLIGAPVVIWILVSSRSGKGAVE
ncbi:MAG: iron ABC transporter permease [Synergistales bacterium]|nr:iron ABC transporter permease [Synergistales bacterium]